MRGLCFDAGLEGTGGRGARPPERRTWRRVSRDRSRAHRQGEGKYLVTGTLNAPEFALALTGLLNVVAVYEVPNAPEGRP